MAGFDPEHLPRGTGRDVLPGERLAIITANLAGVTTRGNVRPGMISVKWGIVMPRDQEFVTPTLFGDVVYDGPPADRTADFPNRRQPYYAEFFRNAPGVTSRPLPQGGWLVGHHEELPEDNPGGVSTRELVYPPYERAGEAGSTQYDVAEPRMVLDALARAMVPGEAEALWIVQQLTPEGTING
jgi:hypothetical protein